MIMLSLTISAFAALGTLLLMQAQERVRQQPVRVRVSTYHPRK
jgi:hypothetical protein